MTTLSDSQDPTTVGVRRPAAAVAAVASAAAAAIHLAVLPGHAGISRAHAVAFGAAAALQAGWALAVTIRPRRGALLAGLAIHGAIAAAWLLSRTVGLPLPPDAWTAEQIGLADLVATGLALVVVALAALLLRPAIAERRLPLRFACSGAGAIALVVLVLTAPAVADGLAHGGGTHEHGADDHGAHSGDDPDEHGTHPVGSDATEDHAPGAHDHEPPVPVDAETQAALDAQLAEARAAIEDHPTVATAEAVGFTRFGRDRPGRPAPGSLHYVDRSIIDGTFDAARPEVIMYESGDPDAVATGLAYVVRSETEPEGFAGPNDHWHRHQACLRDGMLVSGDLPAEECSAAGGTSPELSDIWMLHVWVAPGWENPDGVFAHRHPDVNPARGPGDALSPERRAELRERLAELTPEQRAERRERFSSRTERPGAMAPGS